MKSSASYRNERPYVLVNMAMTADGKIASANRAVTTFGSPRDQHHLYTLRATADAIVCGARTVEETGATLGNGGAKYAAQRLRHYLAGHPLRILVSGSGSLDLKAPVFQERFSPILILTTQRVGAKRLRQLESVADAVWVADGPELDFRAAFIWLRRNHGVRRLLCEGGGELNDAVFRANLVDELHLTICPHILGGRTASTIADGLGVSHLAKAGIYQIHSFQAKNGELFTVWKPVKKLPKAHSRTSS